MTSSCSQSDSLPQSHQSLTFSGTTHYVAPEVILSGKFHIASDKISPLSSQACHEPEGSVSHEMKKCTSLSASCDVDPFTLGVLAVTMMQQQLPFTTTPESSSRPAESISSSGPADSQQTIQLSLSYSPANRILASQLFSKPSSSQASDIPGYLYSERTKCSICKARLEHCTASFLKLDSETQKSNAQGFLMLRELMTLNDKAMSCIDDLDEALNLYINDPDYDVSPEELQEFFNDEKCLYECYYDVFIQKSHEFKTSHAKKFPIKLSFDKFISKAFEDPKVKHSTSTLLLGRRTTSLQPDKFCKFVGDTLGHLGVERSERSAYKDALERCTASFLKLDSKTQKSNAQGFLMLQELVILNDKAMSNIDDIENYINCNARNHIYCATEYHVDSPNYEKSQEAFRYNIIDKEHLYMCYSEDFMKKLREFETSYAESFPIKFDIDGLINGALGFDEDSD
jgi:hypothetical protein